MNARWLVAALFAGGVGWLAGRATIAPSSPHTGRGSESPGVGPTTILPAGTAIAADCDGLVAERLDELDELRRDAYGEAVPFPPDLEAAFLPAAIEAYARRMETDCPHLGWKLLDVECSEYPCFTVWDTPDDSQQMRATHSDAMDCGAAVTFPGIGFSGTSQNGMLVGPNGERVEVWIYASFPMSGPGSKDDVSSEPSGGRRKSRLSYRKDLVLAGLRETYWEAPR